MSSNSYVEDIFTALDTTVSAAVSQYKKYAAKGGMQTILKQFDDLSNKTNDQLRTMIDHQRGKTTAVPAIPANESLGNMFVLAPGTTTLRVVGTDGSQIYPATESPVIWGYVRAVAIGENNEFLETGQFFSENMLVSPTGFGSSKSLIDSWRETLEMQVIARGVKIPSWDNCIFLADGSLLPWAGSSRQLTPSATEYQNAYIATQGRNIAAIVSGPRSKYMINTLQILDSKGNRNEKYHGLTDSMLFFKLLEVGERSSCFIHGSPVNELLRDQQAQVYAFYLRTAQDEIVRVEIPEWVAKKTSHISEVHASVLADCDDTGYPICLMEAHELAKIPRGIAQDLQAEAIYKFEKRTGRVFRSAKKAFKDA